MFEKIAENFENPDTLLGMSSSKQWVKVRFVLYLDFWGLNHKSLGLKRTQRKQSFQKYFPYIEDIMFGHLVSFPNIFLQSIFQLSQLSIKFEHSNDVHEINQKLKTLHEFQDSIQPSNFKEESDCRVPQNLTLLSSEYRE